eukprot:1151915-Pelagomonas_calceolata.AAC.3
MPFSKRRAVPGAERCRRDAFGVAHWHACIFGGGKPAGVLAPLGKSPQGGRLLHAVLDHTVQLSRQIKELRESLPGGQHAWKKRKRRHAALACLQLLENRSLPGGGAACLA